MRMPVAASMVTRTSDMPPRPQVCVYLSVLSGRRIGRQWRTRWWKTTQRRSRSVFGTTGPLKTERQIRAMSPGRSADRGSSRLIRIEDLVETADACVRVS
jgi:hypothetical protein